MNRRDFKRLLINATPWCWYCAFPLPNWGTLDHLRPTSLGGGDGIENLRLACWRCNKRKADRSLIGLQVHVQRGVGVVRQSTSKNLTSPV